MFDALNNLFGTVWSVLGGILSLIELVFGLVTLFFGRKLFWVFSALIGLTVGLLISSQFLQDFIPAVHFFIAALLAIGFAVMAVYVERFMIVLTGFLGTGLLGYFLVGLFKIPQSIQWILFLGAGVLGAVLISRYMEWALVSISALLGAIMAGAGLGGLTHFNFLIDLLLFIALLAGGIFYQSRGLKKK